MLSADSAATAPKKPAIVKNARHDSVKISYEFRILKKMAPEIPRKMVMTYIRTIAIHVFLNSCLISLPNICIPP